MKIECELTQEEEDALSMLLGLATGIAKYKFGNIALAKTSVRLMNKLYARNPDYVPYDENAEDLKRIPTQ